MELEVEGEELKGPVPVEIATRYARQIAAALEAAHERNIIHRDLKPANIKVSEEGQIKVLDFGIAKVVEPEAPSDKSSASPSPALHGTHAGTILGSAGYMSPEQARGKPVDRRADIWAFGAIFYELLTGSNVFEGESVPEKIAAVLRDEIDWSRLPVSDPASGSSAPATMLAARSKAPTAGHWRCVDGNRRPPGRAARAGNRNRSAECTDREMAMVFLDLDWPGARRTERRGYCRLADPQERRPAHCALFYPVARGHS